MHGSRWIPVSLLVALSAWMVGSWTQVALACSGGACASPRAFPAGGDVPVNQFRVKIWPGSDPRTAGLDDQLEVTMTDVSRGLQRAVETTITPLADGSSLLSLVIEPTPNTHLVLEVSGPDCKAGNDLRAEYTINAAAPTPETLGTLDAAVSHGTLRVATRVGSCFTMIEAVYADLMLTLSEPAKPFANVIDYHLIVDGRVTARFADSLVGPTEMPRGQERVYASCTPNANVEGSLDTGTHRAKLVGTLPDGAELASSEVSFVLNCLDASGNGEAGAAGVSLPMSAGAGADPPGVVAGDGAPLAGAGTRTAEPRAGSSAQLSAAGAEDDVSTRTPSAGCSIAKSARGQGTCVWLLGACALVVLRTRRRRAERP